MYSRRIKKIIAISFSLFFLWSLILCKQQSTKTVDIDTVPDTYVGETQCKSCHTQEHTEWIGSHHDLAMKPPQPEFVRGNFNNAFYKEDGVTYLFYKKDSTYFVDVTELEGTTKSYAIAYTFGWEPLQQYLIKFPNGNFQTLRASWDTKSNKWFHQYPDTIIPTDDWLHWTGNAQVWNAMCASCHSTNLKKNFTESTRTYNTTYDIINVSCEACHGPGNKHVTAMQNENYTGENFYTRLDKSSKDMQINVCGTCHGRRTVLTANNNPQTDFLQYFIPDVLTTEFYYPDGQQLEEVYNYGSFLSSKMYRYGVVCTDCHNPHSGKIKLEGNTLCLQCHTPDYDSPTHHFHAEKTAGAQCKSCHMDGRNYMVNDYRHDHSFRVPRPDQSEKFGTPNACISCHENKTNTWAAEAIRKWYGGERKYHFSDDLIPGSLVNEKSFPHLQKLLADTAVNAIVKATAITYMSYLPDQSAINEIITATTNTSPLVRTNAFISLLNYRQNMDVSVLIKGLTDPVRAVRVAAFRVLANPEITKIDDAHLAAYTSVQSEYLAYLDANADFAAGQILKGEYYQEINDLQSAEKHYLNALTLDKLLEVPRLNLAIIYSKQNLTIKTWEQLQLLMQHHPQNNQAYYYAALLASEENNFADAVVYMAKAISLAPNPTYYYNYVLILLKNNDRINARNQLQIALQLFPSDTNLQSLTPYVK